MNKKVSLVKMEIGKTGKIIEIRGGEEMSLKLERLGIRIGEEIKKISQQAMHGPVVVEAGKSQVAVGFGMAAEVMVEIKEAIDENTSNG
jgi:Fe2+ transport system protein FeoA